MDSIIRTSIGAAIALALLAVSPLAQVTKIPPAAAGGSSPPFPISDITGLQAALDAKQGSITCADTRVLFADGANTPGCDPGLTYNKTTDTLTAGAVETLRVGAIDADTGAVIRLPLNSSLTINAQNRADDSNGETLFLLSGNATFAGRDGGTVSILAGTGTDDGGLAKVWAGQGDVDGGRLDLRAGAGIAGTGGIVDIFGGDAASIGGNVNLKGGTAAEEGGSISIGAGGGDVTNGNVNFDTGSGAGTPGNINFNFNGGGDLNINGTPGVNCTSAAAVTTVKGFVTGCTIPAPGSPTIDSLQREIAELRDTLYAVVSGQPFLMVDPRAARSSTRLEKR